MCCHFESTSKTEQVSSRKELTRLVMLCDKGPFLATACTTSGTLAATTLPRRSLAAAAGSSAATMALTTATPSSVLWGETLCAMTCRVLEALTPPMQTVGMPPWPLAARAERMVLTPWGPMIDLVSFFVAVAKTVPMPR